MGPGAPGGDPSGGTGFECADLGYCDGIASAGGSAPGRSFPFRARNREMFLAVVRGRCVTTEVQVRFFGSLTRLAGRRTRTIRIEGEVPSVRDLRAAIARQVPEVAPHLHHTAIAAGTELLGDESPLPPKTEISLLPPVSGG